MAEEKQPEPKWAVALRYDDDKDSAPRVVAKGRGEIAERIMQLARENKVPLRQDANLVRVLSKLQLDQEIPPQLYQVVAAIMSVLYRANKKP